ncbi:MAG TPA: 4'-phosphopantetheinyl transferase superfamily protein [Novosphingobium sp.]|nr:4'-phosphopantetheinyl transferase superfamily protein [Novosphingobium sp.]
MEDRASAALDARGFRGRRLDAPFPVWLVAADARPGEALLDGLGAAEHERADRYARQSLRDRYLTAHCALRTVVEAASGIPPALQTYLPGAYGKPLLQEAPELHCSISYGGQFALVALAMGVEIGVDLEVVRPIEDTVQLAAMYYTRDEIAQLARRSAGEADHAFLTVWVRKEACSKALGKGLSIPPASFECGVGCGVRDVLIENEIVESNVLDPKGGLLASWAWKGRIRK